MTDAEDAARLVLATPPRGDLEAIAAALPGALATGLVATVRLDMPGASDPELRRAADRLREICHAADVAIVIRDHVGLVGPLGLDGVQVSLPGANLKKVRAAIGPDAILGVDCGASRHDGMTAGEAGAAGGSTRAAAWRFWSSAGPAWPPSAGGTAFIPEC